ncbi:MAG TPA: N-6 DNA methylase [Myxococcota bacterium]|mgnify:CR=1 FL=1|nr:N-6 DNA methylase [Myxococcota bacterium]HQK50003.1 N-6 DNA methylase [Myxococcota bacterium]
MARLDPHVLAHLEWLGFVRPTGLVVSAPALVRAGAILNRSDAEGQHLLRDFLEGGDLPGGIRETEQPYGGKAQSEPSIRDFRAFARSVLGWSFSPKGYAGIEQALIPPELHVPLPDIGETLRPDYAVREPDPEEGAPPWQLLVQVLEPSADFDRPTGGRLDLPPHSRMERLLRETRVPAGLLVNGRALRLVSAPRGESSGWLDFQVADMVQTMGRPICAALRLLLGERRLLALPRHQRLAALLAESRKFQNEVSERLAEQVLHALYELLRGFQAAHDASRGELLRHTLAEEPNEVYHALLTVILRLVFLLYAEERGMLPDHETFLRSYSLAGLHERLREDAALHPDTMDQRYGAWAQLLALFRMVHEGARAPGMQLPRRRGVLFDPDRFPFLEGRRGGSWQDHERITPPLVPDGTIYRVLEKLLVLDGERISYRALDVEQIGSVYETMMGFRLETATGRSVAIRSQKRHGAPATVDLEALLAEPAANRAKWIQDRADRKPTDAVKRRVEEAMTIEDLHAALLSLVDQAATPDLMPRGAMVLQPSEERRRSGSHYTPRSLTEPIVRTTLDPILARLREPDGRPPRPEQILDLKVCDPAMGSGAFLVETCRYLADALIESWHAHREAPAIPPDEDEVVHARRLVAQRCLYGVDRNPVAVDLAKMSLWLVTLAKDHPLTFVDHALRHGDSLVGLSRRQIEAFHWETDAPIFQAGFEAMRVREHLEKVSALRREIREAGEGASDLRGLWDKAQFEIGQVRLLGDLAVAAFFEGEKPKDRERRRAEFADAVVSGVADRYRAFLEDRRHADPPLAPFHWEIEFPEVFERENPGFDAIVGNPPFMGGTIISTKLGERYRDWLYDAYPEAKNRCDLVAYFFRRAFALLRVDGTFGLIATNTIAQGDTRGGGLRWICQHGGEIYAVRKRVKWPGMAAVVVSVVHVMKGALPGPKRLDDREVPKITAFLFHRGSHADPTRLLANKGKQFEGVKIYGQGFTFDDTDTKGVATPIAEMERILAEHPDYREVIFPYIGGEEVNTSPTHAHHRYVINFGERSEEECRRRWPEFMAIVEAKVKPERVTKDAKKYPRMVHEWWKYWNARPELYAAIAGLERVLVISRVGQQAAVSFLPAAMVYADSLIVFPFPTHAAFCALQARPHEVWARFFGSSMKDDLRYTPSDCFETFPFPEGWETHPALEAAGKAYYDFRAALMVKNNEGLTKTYNRFHDPNETDPGILRLRELHAAMDRAVLEAYGWTDLPTDCDFFLDYEVDEEEWGDKKRPWRYRWPDEVHAEVLARLLDLNADRARAESRSGAAAAGRRDGKKAAEGATKGELL